MISIKITSVRPDKQTHFFESDGEFLVYRDQTYISTGKILEINVNFSEDKLTKTTVLVFSDQTYKVEYSNDPVILKNKRRSKLYNLEHSITVTGEKL